MVILVSFVLLCLFNSICKHIPTQVGVSFTFDTPTVSNDLFDDVPSLPTPQGKRFLSHQFTHNEHIPMKKSTTKM